MVRTGKRARNSTDASVLLVAAAGALEPVERMLLRKGWAVVAVPSVRAAERQVAEAPAPLAIVPEARTSRATIALLRKLQAAAPTMGRVVLLRGADAGSLLAYANTGAADYLLPPPLTGSRLHNALREVLARHAPPAHAADGKRARSRRTQRGDGAGSADELARVNNALRRSMRELARKNKALLTLAESLRVQSTTDALTGLFNRREFLNRIRTEWGRFRRYGRPLSLIMLDIDHFKRVNDSHGHECGDVVLRDLGRLIDHNKRAQDVCCRYGGEEFTVLLTETTLDGAFRVAEGLRRLIAEHEFVYEGQVIPVRVTLGVAGAVEHNPPDSEAFVNLADKAMYRAKRLGRDRTVVLDPADESRVLLESPPAPPPHRSPPRAGGTDRRRHARLAGSKS